MKPEFKIDGQILELESEKPLAGLFVKAYDKDLLFDDLVGTGTTDKEGRFEIIYSQKDFKELFERRPDLYFLVFATKTGRPIHSTVDQVRWNAGVDEQIKILVPGHKLPLDGPLGPETVALLNAQGRRVSDLEAGDSFLISVSRLTPNRSYGVMLRDERGNEILSASLVANRFGVIAPTVIWPDIGIGLSDKGGPYAFESHEAALRTLGGQTLALAITDKGQVVREASVPIAKTFTGRRLFPTSTGGTLQRGFLLEKDDLQVTGRNFPEGAVVDLYLVPRRFNWRTGDAFIPARSQKNEEITVTVQLADKDTSFVTNLAYHDDLLPGSYDIVARITQPGEYMRHERVLREADFVSERLITTLVVRDDVFRYKPVKMGCINAMEIAGKMLWGVPEEMEHTNNFPVGTDVWAALDPAGLMPEAFGKKVRYYVVQHKTAAEWTADYSLADVTGTVTEVITSPSCVNANAALVWSNPTVPGKYDLVADFGNNTPDPTVFVADDTFNPPMDMIDGYFVAGFHVTEDPSTAGSFPVGQTSYNEAAVTIPAVGVWHPTVSDGIYGETASGTMSLSMNAVVRYPAVSAGVETDVSTVAPSYPVVVIMHGMHTSADPSYLGYNYLLDHLASHGFIAVSIDCNDINDMNGMQDTRAHAILEHLSLLNTQNITPGLFFGKIDMTRIGIMGHSRGGDGVVQAEVLNQSLALGYDIKAVVTLAPTDFSGTGPSPLNLSTSKLLCLYGANDGDVWGGTNPANQYTGTGFRFYDRATVEKAMVFMYGATHNRFNLEWGTEDEVDTSSPKVLSGTQHQGLLCGYMTAFMQVHLQDRPEQRDYFTGVLKIPSVSSVEVHCQYRPDTVLTLDNFESAAVLNQNTLGGPVSYANLDDVPEENPLSAIDGHTPHQTRGIRLRWASNTATYNSEIPSDHRNLVAAGMKFLCFRVSQKVGSGANPIDQLRDLRIRLSTSGGGPSRSIRAGYFDTVPYPYKPEYVTSYDPSEDLNTKSALKTVRIPLDVWTTKCLNVPMVDLADVESVTFEFDYHATGELEIDDVEFTE
ncbi:MAG: hypothetical protein GY854_29300 [Deltaproteobacteria bacterium]|nr:hypothetical protein [Deltaproteobacteria bacterium]